MGLQRLCNAAAAELAFDGVSVTLMTTAGTFAMVAASDLHLRRLEELQFDLGEGPAREVFASGRPVLVPDLRAETSRWPGFAPAAVSEHMLAVFTFPLQLGAVRFGVLTCLGSGPRRIVGDELSACLIFTEVATELLLDSSPGGSHPDPDLREALASRSEVYQAQGFLMVELGTSLSDALAQMRATAYAEGVTLHDLAADIIAGRRTLTLRTDPPDAPSTPPDDAE